MTGTVVFAHTPIFADSCTVWLLPKSYWKAPIGLHAENAIDCALTAESQLPSVVLDMSLGLRTFQKAVPTGLPVSRLMVGRLPWIL